MSGNVWRWISASVRGTSHLTAGTECQDNHACLEIESKAGPVLLAFVSDGAGSALRSAAGSRLLCELMMSEAQQFFTEQGQLDQLNARVIAGWIEQFRSEIILQADTEGLTDREFACTLLGAIFGPTSAAFFQVGDGAIVYSSDKGGEYTLAFWPERGEYENTTFFVTQSTFFDQLQFVILDRPVVEAALFSDGLQRLALNYQTRGAHQPFFNGIFSGVRSVSTEKLPQLNEQLAQFLDSPKVNERTDDDKTLLLAVAIPAIS
jgi:hypothetical protein